MDLDKIRELIRIFEAADISEIEIEEEEGRILLKKAKPAPVVVPQTHISPSAAPPAPSPAETGESMRSSLPTEPAGEDLSELAPEEDADLETIDAPMVGVFYAAPAPGEPPFVKLGDTIDAGETVCIVEAMKLMNEVTAKAPVIIERILVENAEPVEFGQPLFAVRPLQ